MALLVLRVTEKCNLNCRYCYAEVENPEDMTFEIAKCAIDEFYKKFGDFKIQFTGGEPILNYELILEIVDYLKKIGISVPMNIQTNGTLLTKEKIIKLNENKIGISISIDGFGRKNDSLRPMKNNNASGFKIVDENISYMAENGIPTQLNAVISKESADFIDELFDYALIKGNIRGISVDVLRNIEKGKDVESADKVQVLKLLKRIKKKLEILNRAGIRIEFKDFSKMSYLVLNNINKKHYCYAQTNESIAVRPNGDFYPCSSLAGDKNFLIGNVKKGVDRIPIFFKISEEREKCRTCEIKNFCCGACPAGRIYGESDLDCVIKKYSYGYSKRMIKEK